MSIKDNFSEQADLYAKYRPHYPDELYQYLFRQVNAFETAWDVGTGNGQVAVALAGKFRKVYGTDISQSQLDYAIQANNIEYHQASAAQSDLMSDSIDLITVGQAVHWFDQTQFYSEVKRVSKPGAVLAYWAYYLLEVSPEINTAIIDFHDNVVGPYWDPERSIWKNKYADIQFPMEDITHKDFFYTTQWTLADFAGYLNTWSAVRHFIRREQINPVNDFISKIAKHWTGTLDVQFPIFLTHGQVA